MTFFTFGDPHQFGLHDEAISTDCRPVKRSPQKKKVITIVANARDATRHC